jgi:hypothetical protein
MLENLSNNSSVAGKQIILMFLKWSVDNRGRLAFGAFGQCPGGPFK